MADEVIRLDSLDSLPAPLRAFFAPVKDGDSEVYEYRAPDTKTAADVAKTMDSLRKERERANRLAEELKAKQSKLVLDDEELDADELRQILAERKALNGKQMLSREEAEKEWEERKAKALKVPQSEIERLTAAIKEREDTLHKVLVDDGIRKVAQDPEAPFRLQPGAADWLIKMARADGSVRVVNGEPVPMDGDKPATNPKGDPMTIMDWVASQVEHYPWLALPSQGTGASPSGNGAASNGRQQRSKMSVPEKAAFIEKHGTEKYLELPA